VRVCKTLQNVTLGALAFVLPASPFVFAVPAFVFCFFFAGLVVL
jgi:hypothetical protein